MGVHGVRRILSEEVSSKERERAWYRNRESAKRAPRTKAFKKKSGMTEETRVKRPEWWCGEDRTESNRK